jgi:hypothetical protein
VERAAEEAKAKAARPQADDADDPAPVAGAEITAEA